MKLPSEMTDEDLHNARAERIHQAWSEMGVAGDGYLLNLILANQYDAELMRRKENGQ